MLSGRQTKPTRQGRPSGLVRATVVGLVMRALFLVSGQVSKALIARISASCSQASSVSLAPNGLKRSDAPGVKARIQTTHAPSAGVAPTIVAVATAIAMYLLTGAPPHAISAPSAGVDGGERTLNVLRVREGRRLRV